MYNQGSNRTIGGLELRYGEQGNYDQAIEAYENLRELQLNHIGFERAMKQELAQELGKDKVRQILVDYQRRG